MRIGVGHNIITPPLGSYLAGFGARTDPSQGVHDDLYVRALVLEERGTHAALVVCDLCGLDSTFVAEVREGVGALTGIAGSSVMVAAIHTHAAPATLPLYSRPPDPGWRTRLPDQAAGAVDAAVRDLAPGALGVGLEQESSVGRNRRSAGGPVDPTVTVLRADRSDRKPVFLIHYACHPTVLGPDNLLISRDYVGFTVDAVERSTASWVMFVNGACGDINAGHSADRSALGLPIAGRTFERAGDLGHRLALAAAQAAARTRPTGTGLRTGTRFLALPLRDTPPLDAMRGEVRTWQERIAGLVASAADDDTLTTARLELMYAEMGLRWVEQRGSRTEETVEIQAFALGDVAILALPGEFFAESALRLRAASPFRHTIAVGYANGGIGYVPPAGAYAEGGYETRLAPWSRVAPSAEAAVLGAAVELLQDLKTSAPTSGSS